MKWRRNGTSERTQERLKQRKPKGCQFGADQESEGEGRSVEN